MKAQELKELYRQLKLFCDAARFEETYSIHFKSPLKIGENDFGDILCVSIDRHVNPFYDEDHIVLHVLFDEHQENKDIYSRDYEFTYLSYHDETSVQPSETGLQTLPHKHKTYKRFEIFDDALSLIFSALVEWGSEWFEHQKQLRIRQRAWLRKCVGKERPFFTWEERLQHLKDSIEEDRLMYNRESMGCVRRLKEMEELGQEVCEANDKKENEIMKSIFDEMKKNGEL